jgi:hypothetical protein
MAKAFNYGKMQKLATGLLEQFNAADIALIKLVPGNGPAHNPGPSTKQTTKLSGVPLAITVNNATSMIVPGSLVQIGDLQVITNVVDGIEPTAADLMMIDGVTYRIVAFNKTPNGPSRVVWKFFVRRN